MADVKEGSKFSDLGNRVKYGVAIAAVAIPLLAIEATAPWLIATLAVLFCVGILTGVYTSIINKLYVDTPITWFFFLIMGLAGFYMAYQLRIGENGFWTVVYVAVGAMVTDIAAYAGGRKYGTPINKNSFFGRISPNKTKEGFQIGYIIGFATLIVLWLPLYILGATNLELWQVGAAAFIIPVSTIAGDLLESKSKRELKIDDYGNLFGAHGGVPDRFDGVSAAFLVYGALYFLILAG